jgi:probable rRNA maturation factor
MDAGAGHAAVDRAALRLEISWSGTELLGQVELDHLSQLVSGVLSDRMGPRPLSIGIRFVEAEEMAELNAEHMGHDGPTDVLSFPIDGDPIDAVFPGPDEPPWLLGDLVICPEVAAANAPSHAGNLDDEMALLVVHGVLHLLGMDHADDDERAAMQARERELLDAYHGPLTRDPWSDS